MSTPIQIDPSIYDVATQILAGRFSIDEFLEAFSDEEAEAILGEWEIWRLEHQTAPTVDFFVWLMFGGRGSGKTHGAAAQCIEWSEDRSNFRGAYGLLGGQTYERIAKFQIEGPSGILRVAPADFRPKWYPGKGLLVFPNGVQWILATGDDPKSFHGPNVAKAWLDELARFKYPKACWDEFMFSLRSGRNPQVIVSTTPSTDPLIAELEDQALSADYPEVVLTRPPTTSNPHLHPNSLRQYQKRYAGTRIGRMQLLGEVLRDLRGALLSLDVIDKHRVQHRPHLDEIVVAVDPVGADDSQKQKALEEDDEIRECGINVAGRGRGPDGDPHGYVLQDCSIAGSSTEWGRAVVAAFKRWQADKVIGEVNFGGDMVRGIIHAVDPRVPFEMVRASRGKRQRAEPVAAAYEQGTVHHVGVHDGLETQWTTWVPGKSTWSPDRMDACVWGLTKLLLEDEMATDPWEAYG